MAAMAIFTCRQNSHPFQERHISLHEPVKIGRSVARGRPLPNNVIFDCKVLSRHHALLWYENEKFYLQDTKSSNGTFINNQRLSKGSEESVPREIWSGDIVQFGVDVMENTKRVTHGCIIACITLFYPDGTEAKNTSIGQLELDGTTLYSQELYQLSQYLQEALHREQMLENKLATLQRLVANTQEASESGWQALIDEDRLLSRLECLENQLHAYAKNQTEDSLRQELVALQEDKSNYETTAKESLRQVLEEKLEAIRKVSDLERSYSNTEDECTHLKELCEATQSELQLLAEKHDEKVKNMNELGERLQEAEKDHAAEVDRINEEKQELAGRIEEMKLQENGLLAKVESLEADNDFTNEQLTAIRARSVGNKEQADDGELIKPKGETDSNNRDVSLVAELKEKLKNTQEIISKYQQQLQEASDKLKAGEEQIGILQAQLEQAQFEVVQNITKVASLEVQLQESQKQTQVGSGLTQDLTDRVTELEDELREYKHDLEQTQRAGSCADSPSEGAESPETDDTSYDTTTLKAPINQTDATKELQERYEEQIEKMKELLEEARFQLKTSLEDVDKCKNEMEVSQSHATAIEEEKALLQYQLSESVQESREQSHRVATLQDQLKKAESSTQEVKENILHLREQLDAANKSAQSSGEEADRLKGEVEQLDDELTELKSKDRLVTTTKYELEQQANKNEVEFTTLKDECSNLRRRIQAVEIEMKTTRKENAHLQEEYVHLQESYNQLQALKDKLENSEVTWKLNLTDAQKEAEITKSKLCEAQVELTSYKERCGTHTDTVSNLQHDLNELTEEYQLIADRSRLLCVCSAVPLFALLLAILLAFYPTLADVTATTQL